MIILIRTFLITRVV